MELLEVYKDRLLGSMRGLDRVRFRGTLRWLANESGMRTFLGKSGILLRDFGKWANGKTRQIRESCARQAEELGIELRYLVSSGIDKEQLARSIAERKNIREGSICMFSVVEPCVAPDVRGDRASGRLELCMRQRKCVWLYHYWDDPELGFGHVRLQTWLPMNVFVCVNGRHWLARQLDRLGVDYVKDRNCFPWVADFDAAQRELDQQLRTAWPTLLDRLLLQTCPALPSVLAPLEPRYYWSAEETEWATDWVFRSAQDLDRLYPSLVRHAMIVSDSPAVMRFLGGRDLTAAGNIKGRAPKEIVSDLRRRHEGIRVKHWINRNSVKLYNKAGNTLRIETTLNNTRDFKVYRCPDDDTSRPASWQRLRKGVSDLHRRCEVSNQANDRYAQSLGAMHDKEPLGEILRETCRPRTEKGRRSRALNPWEAEDHQMLTFLAKGEWTISGFRNKDLRAVLFPANEGLSQDERARRSGRVTRRIRLLRAHGLIRKVQGANRYVLTTRGHRFSVALAGVDSIPVEKVMEMAS